MNFEIFEFLGKEVPNSISEIRESLDLLNSSIDNAIDQVGDKINCSFKDKNYAKVTELTCNTEELEKLNAKIQDAINYLDNIIDTSEAEENEEEDEITERGIPNYREYYVDNEIEHNLYEDLTHKRPCAIKIDGNKIEVKDWKSTLVSTINYLGEKDPKKLLDFVDNPKMNGKKVIYFSRVKLPNMRAPRKIDSANIYVETNLSANGIRNLIVKSLNKYNIKLVDYKIYFKADYSDLH